MSARLTALLALPLLLPGLAYSAALTAFLGDPTPTVDLLAARLRGEPLPSPVPVPAVRRAA